MHKIADVRELTVELERLLRDAEKPSPSRVKLSQELAMLGARILPYTLAETVLLRFAKVFSSPEAMQAYLKTHPKANPAKHSVKQKAEKPAPAPKKPKAEKPAGETAPAPKKPRVPKPKAEKPVGEAAAPKKPRTRKPKSEAPESPKAPAAPAEEKKSEPKEDPATKVKHNVHKHFVDNVKNWYEGDTGKDSPMGKLLSQAEKGEVDRRTLLDAMKSMPNANEYPKGSAKAKHLTEVHNELNKLYDN